MKTQQLYIQEALLVTEALSNNNNASDIPTLLSRINQFYSKKPYCLPKLSKSSQHLQEVIEETSISSAYRLFINQMKRVAIKQECNRRACSQVITKNAIFMLIEYCSNFLADKSYCILYNFAKCKQSCLKPSMIRSNIEVSVN